MNDRMQQVLVRTVIAVLVCMLTGCIALIVINRDKLFGTTSTQTFRPTIDSNAVEWTEPEPQHKGDPDAPGIKIPGYPSVSVSADTEDVAIRLLNPEGNPCYFTFTLVLADTDEVLYTSDMVAPGQVINQIRLTHPLSAGEYRAVIRITTAALTDGSPMNGANVETLLIVK